MNNREESDKIWKKIHFVLCGQEGKIFKKNSLSWCLENRFLFSETLKININSLKMQTNINCSERTITAI